MTKETFEQILRERNILWNDLVELEVFNPNYVKTLFRKYPKTIKFQAHWVIRLATAIWDYALMMVLLKQK